MATKKLTLPGYDNETFGAFLNAMHEQQEEIDTKKIMEKKKLELQKKKFMMENMPTFETPDIQGPDDISKRILTLKKKLNTHEDNVFKLVENYFKANNVSRLNWNNITSVEQLLSDENFISGKHYAKLVQQQDFKFLLDEYMENAIELMYWEKDTNKMAYKNLSNIYRYYEKGYPDMYKNHTFKVLTDNSHAYEVMKTHEWEYVKKNSLIKEYVVNTIYHFKNGKFRYQGGDITDYRSWEPVTD